MGQRPGNPPHLFDAQLPCLRYRWPQPEVVERDPGQVSLRPFGQHGHPGHDVAAWFEIGERRPSRVATFVAGTNADGPAPLHQQLLGGRLGQHHGPDLFGLGGQPAAELGQRDDDVAPIAHRRRSRDPQGGLTGQHVHHLAGHRPEARDIVQLEPGSAKSACNDAGIDDRPRQQMGAGLLALLYDRNGHLTQRSGHLGVLLEELPQPDGAGQPGRSRPHDHDADLDLFLGRAARLVDEVGGSKRRRIVRRPHHHAPLRCRKRATSCGTIVCTSPITARSLASKIGADGILVDGDHDLRALHAHLVLHRAGDAQRHVELR